MTGEVVEMSTTTAPSGWPWSGDGALTEMVKVQIGPFVSSWILAFANVRWRLETPEQGEVQMTSPFVVDQCRAGDVVFRGSARDAYVTEYSVLGCEISLNRLQRL